MKVEKQFIIYVLIAVQVRPYKGENFTINLKSGRGFELFEQPLRVYSFIIILSCHQHGWNIRTNTLSSSSRRAISTDIPDPLSPHLPIIHSFRQVFRATSCISAELLYVGSSWSSCLCLSMWRCPQEYIPYELAPTSPDWSCMSGSSNIDSFRNVW